ncbi:MAG: dGTP triphosphohydrolase [Gemmataceae bacterium]
MSDRDLAPPGAIAMRSELSRGRVHPEPRHPLRSEFQRDRDRIIYCTAFRRLMHKTQVMTAQGSDHHRTRMTHTLEVTEIARTIARCLGLNEDLTEAIALSHDLGHPPFGHAGEGALDECLAGVGGFEHNEHALRLVDFLEHPYPDFHGLNLTWEVREAMAWHSSRDKSPTIQELRSAGYPLLEARVADAADSLAYVCHDLDDAVEAKLIQLDDVAGLSLVRRASSLLPPGRVLSEDDRRSLLVRTLVDMLVRDLVDHTRRQLDAEGIHDLASVRSHPGPLVEQGHGMREEKRELAEFLRRHVYYHRRVLEMSERGAALVRSLMQAFLKEPQALPPRYRSRLGVDPAARIVGDYVAGMTDRFAEEEHDRLGLKTP